MGRRLPPTIPYPVPSLAVPGTNKEKTSKCALCQSAYFKKLRVCLRLLSIVRRLVGYFCTSYLMHIATQFLEKKTFFYVRDIYTRLHTEVVIISISCSLIEGALCVQLSLMYQAGHKYYTYMGFFFLLLNVLRR